MDGNSMWQTGPWRSRLAGTHWLGSRTGSADSSEWLQRALLRVFELEHTGLCTKLRYKLQILNLKISLKMHSE